MLTRILALVFACLAALCASLFFAIGKDEVFAQSPVTVLHSNSSNGLTQNFSVLIDAEGKLKIEDVVKADAAQFLPGATQPLHPGYTSAHYWIKTTLKNASENKNADWYIMPDYPLLDADAYLIDEKGTIQKAEVDDLQTRFPVSKIFIPPGQERVLYLNISSPLALNLQFKVITESQYKNRINEENTLLGIIAGIFAAMILYNLFLYAALRDKDYFYYLFFVTVNAHINLLSTKYPEGIFEWFGLNWWPLVDVYRPLAPLTTLLFARSFLQTQKEHPKVDRWIVAYLSGLVAFMVASFFVPRHILFPLEDLYFLFAIILLVTAGVVSLRRGFRPSHFYLFGLTLFVVGMGIYIAKSEGALPTNPFTLNGYLVFHAFEMIFMSLALSGKIKEMEKHAIRAEVTAGAKGRLLRVISHDIANPLGIVKGMAYIMRNEPVDQTRIEAISRAVKVIEEILQFVHKTESIDNGNKIATESVNLAEVFDGLEFVFKKPAVEKNIALNFLLEQPDISVKAEKTSLTYEVLGNFVGNAIKFTNPGGEITVRASVVDQKTHITIQDNGIGMSERVVAAAFDPTVNVSRRGTLGEKGGGYGLLLAKAYVDQFDASIKIESTPQGLDQLPSGTCITVTFQNAQAVRTSRSLRQRWRLIP